MAQPTAQEQYFLELVNRARLNPLAEAQVAGIDLNAGLAAGTITAAQKQPLAWNAALGDAALAHSNWMLAADAFSHTGQGGSSLGQRLTSSGYGYTRAGENIAWVGTTGVLNFNASMLQLHLNLFKSAGHRTNLLDGAFKELGIGAVQGQFLSGGTNWNAAMVTQDFGTSGTASFVTGVAYNDTSGDKFYSIGEGQGGISAILNSGAATIGSGSTGTAGGYNLSTALTGGMTMTFGGGALAAPVGVYFVMGAENVKIDLVNNNTIQSSATAALTGTAANLTLIGINDLQGNGNALGNTITGNAGANALAGLAGDDTLIGNQGNDVLIGGLGADTLLGGSGSDWAHYGNAANGVSVYLAYGIGQNGEAQGDTLTGIEHVWGTDFNDTLMGDADANYLFGNNGHDVLIGDLGADYLDGGAGNDWAYYAYATSGVAASLISGAGSGGEAAGDSLVNIEALWGSAFSDQLTGNAAGNQFCGAQGNDTLTGGGGADLFMYMATGFGADIVTDFADGADLVYFASMVAANFGALTISGNGTANVLITAGGGSIMLQGAGPITLTASDFLFA
jgi:Ca2+-binding RTX toxin-like protein